MSGMEHTQFAAQDINDGKTTETWALDVVCLPVDGGKPLQTFVVVAQPSGLILTIAPGQFDDGQQIANALDRVAAEHGYPAAISTDRGVTFFSNALRAWANEHGVKHNFQAVHKPDSDLPFRPLRVLPDELREGTFKLKARGLEADHARSLAEWVTRYNESKLKAQADDRATYG